MRGRVVSGDLRNVSALLADQIPVQPAGNLDLDINDAVGLGADHVERSA